MKAQVPDSLIVQKISITGNERTNNSIILREMSLSLGQAFVLSDLEKEVERSRRNIFNTNLFIWVVADIETVADSAVINIEVKEKLYLLPLPILYLADRSFNEWWYNRDHDIKRVIYGLQLNHSNLTGNADVLKLKAYGGFIPYFELSYAKPYIDRRQRMGLRGGVFFSRQKSFPVRTWEDKLDFLETEEKSRRRLGAFVEYNLRNALYHFHTLYLGFTDLSISDSAKAVNPSYLGNAENRLPYFTFQYDYRFDQRDNFLYPLEGQVINLSLVNYGMGISDFVNHTRIGAEYFGFLPIHGKLYADFKFRSQVSFPKKQLYPFVLGFGYRNALVRGYELNVIDGQHFALAQTDLKCELLKRTLNISKFLKIKQFNSVPLSIFARSFIDVGYVKNYFPELSKSNLSNKALLGYGLGLDLVTFYETVLKLNYSVNQTGFNKVYFGVQRAL